MVSFRQPPPAMNTFDTEHIKDKTPSCFFRRLMHQPAASNSHLVEMKDKVLKEFLFIDDTDIAFLATKDFRTIQELEKLTLSELNLMNDEEEIKKNTYDSLRFYVMWKPSRTTIESMTRDQFDVLDRKSIEDAHHRRERPKSLRESSFYFLGNRHHDWKESAAIYILKEFLFIDDDDIALLAMENIRTIKQLKRIRLRKLDLIRDKKKIKMNTYDSLRFFIMWNVVHHNADIESITRREFFDIDRKSIEEEFLQMKNPVAIRHSNSTHIERRQSRHRKQATATTSGGRNKSPRSVLPEYEEGRNDRWREDNGGSRDNSPWLVT